jgi:hypothetical protein
MILASHYTYGAIFWILGVLLWSARVLPKVLLAEPAPPKLPELAPQPEPTNVQTS